MSQFVCLEGVDGVGKTEIAQSVARQLGYQYYKSPGPKFAAMRESVDQNIDPLTRYFFYRAATQDDSCSIRRLLETTGVVCDRYIYSARAVHGAMDAKIQSLFEMTQLIVPDYTFVLTSREEVRTKRVRSRRNISELEQNLPLQNEADRLFKTFGFPVIDTSDTTVEEATSHILSILKGRS